MPISMLKTPDERDTDISFTLSKGRAPYVRAYFDVAARDGETLDDFIKRLVCEQSVDHVMRTTLVARKASRESDQLTDDGELAAEKTTILGDP